jgi:hypothetical protein
VALRGVARVGLAAPERTFVIPAERYWANMGGQLNYDTLVWTRLCGRIKSEWAPLRGEQGLEVDAI